jgi:hypothetical protein
LHRTKRSTEEASAFPFYVQLESGELVLA